MSACAVPELMAKDPRFQALKKAYEDKHYSDDHIAQALQLYRERTGRDVDWFPESPQYRAAFTRFINNHLVASKLAKTTSELDKDSVYNMYTTLYSLYTPERLDNRIKMIARDFRQIVDILEKNDRTNRTRQQLIEAQGDDKQNGFSKIMQRVFKNYEDKFTSVDKMMSVFDAKYPNATETQRANALRNARHRADEYKTVLANKERLAALAATSIGEDEGFVVNIRNFEVDLTEYDEDERSLADGSFEDGNDDGHDKEEGSKGDRFADFRTLKLMSTLSVRARRLISRIPKVRMVEENGVRKYKPIKDDLGVDQYIGGRQVAVILKRVLVNSSPDTMMSDLRTAAEFYPWLNSLILELERNADAQTTVYNNFKSAESTYVYVNLESKKRKVDYGDGEHTVWESNYIPKVANTRAAKHALMREAENNAKGGYVLDEDNTVYTGYGSLVSLEEIQKRHERFVNKAKKIVQSGQGAMWIRMVDKDAQATSAIKGVIDTYGEEYKYLLGDPETAMKTFLDRNPGVVSQIVNSLRGLGFPIREKDIREIATQKMNKKSFGFLVGFNNTDTTKGRNKLYQLVEFIDNAFTRAEEIQKKKQEATGQYLYGTSRSFEKINNCLALAKYNEVEARVLNEGKSLSTYNHVNLLHQTFDSLMNSDHRPEQKYQEDIEDDYLQYEGMALGYGDRKQAKGWLKMFQENTNGIRDKMRIIDCAAFNHVEYADLSRRQKLTNSIVMYFGGSNTFQADGYAAYEVPIQADYSTAYNFILAPKLAVGLDQSDVVEALVDEVKMELERIAAIEARIKDDSRIKLSVYEEQGLKFQIFPAFNDNGFRQKYTALADKAHAAERLSHIVGERAVEPLARQADNFIREQIQEQMTAIVQRDLKTIEDAGVLSNPAMKHIHFGYGNYGSLYSKDGKIGNLKEDQLARLNEYCQNVFYARQQIVKLLTGGTEQFNGLIDFEKRNMLSHATHTSLYTKATWKGEPVGRETQNVVYIEDDNASSAFLEDIKEMALQLKNAGIISTMQYDTMIKAYSKIKTTDGQGMRTLESYRRVMIMADQWDERHESAYQNIVSGKPTKGDVAVFMQNIKPVLTGYETVPAAVGENQKPVKLTVLHKYSEMVLLPMALSKYCLQNKSVPMQALEDAQKKLKDQEKEIDMFLFHSGVKVGAHSILQPFAKDKKTGERILKTASDISRYLVNGVNGAASTVHTIPFKYYGIAAFTPAHVADDRIAWASQAEKVAWANIDRNTDSIELRGEKKNAWDARETYNKIKSADIIQMYTEIRKLFNDPDELEEIFQTELASKSYSSRELSYALSHLKDGTFALPLYSPNVEHQVQQLLASIIKKRLTKPKLKGANILQSTGLGMDVEASSFDNTNALSEDEKLHIVFEGTGNAKRIKYVEVYLPIHDSRLLQFADENGNITYEMLYGKKGGDGKRHGGLVERGVIPESVLNFIAYRTPSDAEHSVIPCRIKGFIANTAGATIRMPKEIMVMTGHDYDGDKMRCHFADFTVGWDEEALSREYQKYINGSSDTDIMKYILGQEEHAYTPDERENITEEEFKKRFKRAERQIGSNRFKKVNYIAYDYNKSALENSKQARANARVELMFSQLTSPAGSKRVIIPGGCDESKVIAKTLYLVRSTDDNDNKKKIADELLRQYKEERYESYAKGVDDPMERDEFFKSIQDDIDAKKNQYDAVVGNVSALYEFLVKRNDGSLTDIVRAVSSAETPYSVTHSADAFDYIMGGAEMIGIYAVYNSAMQMLQRLDLRYVPKLTEKGKPYVVDILGHKWGQPDEKKGITGKLFEVRNHEGNLASLGLARLLNAAVDNNKDPILGYLMQTKEMAETTFLMFAAGMTEEEIHLFMNQPAIVELISRMKQSDNKGLYGEAAKLITELSENNEALANESSMSGGQWFALSNVAEMSRADFTKNLALKYENIKEKQDLDLLREQVSLLQVLLHLQPAANNLAEFVRLTRPESESGSIGTTVSSMITKTIALRKFREKLEQSEDQDIRISGMWDVIAPRDVFDGVDEKYLEEVIGDELPEVVALNSLMLDSSLDIFEPFFPTAKKSWIDVAETIASAYRYNKIQEGTVEKIGKEMILWKLLGHPKFVQGDPQVEQKRIIVDVPKNLKDLKQRIGRASDNPGKDPAADALVGNAFLMNLTTTDPTSTVAPRLQFQLNGPAVEGTADAIRASWGEMLNSSDEKIRQLAIDLFKYNLYTNGFSYGMYEFSHFAPFSVIVKTPGYIEALKDILHSNWDDEADTENFIHQYYMNHWGDKKFLPQVKASTLKVVTVPQGVTGQIWLSDKMNERTLGRIIKARYIVLTREEGQEQTLWRVLPGNNEAPVILERAEKLGVRNFNSQVTLQYNPRTRNYKDVHPVIPGNDSAWGQLDELNTHAESDISNPKDTPTNDKNYMKGLVGFGKKRGLLGTSFFIKKTGEQLAKVEKQAAVASSKNEGKIPSASSPVSQGRKWGKKSANGFEVSTAAKGDNGDSRFSALNARLSDGRTIEEAYQLDVKGYRQLGYTWSQAKHDRGVHAPIPMTPTQLYDAYLSLWRQWANENPKLIEELREKSRGKVLTDVYASDSPTAVSQARALAQILDETEQNSSPIEEPQETAPMQKTSVTKIISGGQTGVDTIGLQIGKKLGLATGGTAPRGFLREAGIDKESIKSYGLVEITPEEQADYTKRTGKSDPYTGRTELNVRNSDGTVYFSTSDDSAGLIATRRAAEQWNKPFLLNPTARQLNQWLIANNISILNVAGNRGSKLPASNKVATILERALAQILDETERISSTSPQQKLVKYNGNWSRSEVVADTKSLYIFTDNTDRNSGSGVIPANSWYSKRYGEGHHYPTMTAAVIRGLDNARPVSTQRWYHEGAKGNTGRWNDADFDVFKQVIDSEFNDIFEAWNSGKYNRIVFPTGDGLFNGRISAITKQRTPILYDYLQTKVKELQSFVNGEYADEGWEDMGLTPEDFNEFAPFGSEPTQTPAPTPSRPLGAGFFGAMPAGVDMSAAAVGSGIEGNGNQMLSIARRDENGNIVTDTVPATPNNVREARKQQTFVELNRRLREILRDKGIDVGVLTNAEARMAIGGVADFDTANVTAEGLLEMIRIAEGYRGEYALPEEFAHVALEMLGHNHPLVSRLLSALDGSQESMEEAYDGQYQDYLNEYGEDNRDKLVLEAAGKLVAKHLFLEQEIQSSPIRRIIHRVVDAIKSLLRRFSRDEVQNAIFDANQIASKIAREMLGGRLVDSMSLENIAANDKMFQKVQKDLSGKQDILSKLLKTETKRLAIFKKRQGRNNKKKSKAIQATEAQIAKLEAAIRNYKTEDAIITYMSDSLGFLAAMEKSLDDVVNGGRSVNVICKRLNLVRDTLYSFSKAIEDIRESIIDGEVQDSANLTATMDQVAGVLEKFFQKYNKLARTYFEEMLSSVYGESGKTITVGKDKGKTISIKDMARRADHDISLVSRWFHSIADCDDYVLKAIDDVARNAKIRARRIAAGIRPRIEVAIADLERATGSRDQSFMFELERGEDGKMHRTGKYITEKASESLSAAQKKFYDTMISIKKEADLYVPETLVSDRKIVMMRKYTMDRFKDAEGAKGKALEAWEGLKNRVMETGDDIDYDNYEVAVDFEGNRVDMLPVKFMMKGKNESYDDMTDDVATSIMAYVGMAYEYNELNSVIGILENAKYMSSQRDVVQKTGTRTQRESVSTDDTVFHEPFTVKQAQTNIQKALDDFFQMHIYGHIRKNEGTIGRTRFSKRKVVDTINAITSYSQMAINIPQRIANVNTGLSQIVIESIGRTGEFSTKDVVWASKIYAKESGDRLAETGKSDYDNKLSLWDEYFDVHQNNGKHDTRYKKGRLSRIFNSSLLYAGLTMGEDYLASTTSLALARNYKVKDASGKEANLWDAYEVKYADSTNKTGAYLALKDGYTKLDGSPITFEDERAFAKKVAGMNFQLQGIYNTDDKSAVQQYAFGALLIMYRKWIAPALKRRYSGAQYNALRGDYEEGYHRTLFRVIRESLIDAKDQVTEEKGSRALMNIIGDMKALKTALVLNWQKLTPYEKSNITRSLSELAFVAGLYLAVALLGKIPPPETDEDAGKVLTWWENTVMSQVLRLRTEIGSQAPTPMLVDEAMHILRSPFAAIEPLQNTINAFELLVPSNYMKEIKSGRYKGHVKAYKYFRELPIISMFKKVDNFLDPSPLINYYQNDIEF